MAERDAKVRLNLAAAGMVTQLQQLIRQTQSFSDVVEGIGEDAEKSNKKVGGLFTAMKAGAGAARGALSELGGHIKNTLMMAATLGGALSVGGAIREAQGLASSYKDIAFAIRAGTGEAVSAAQVQGHITAVADRWKVKTSEVRDSYAALFQETGNLKFTAAAANSVAQAHVATGKSVATLTSLAGLLNDKFGITEEKLDDVLASAIELGNKGGGSIEDFASQLGELGAIAKSAGLTGEDGFRRMAGMVNIADGPMKNMKQSLSALRNLFARLADPDNAKQIEKALGVKVTDAGGGIKSDALERILAKTKGKQSELAKVFSGQELRLASDLGKGFAKAFEETKGDVKTKTAAGIDAYKKALDAAGETTLTGAEVKEEAEKRLNDAQRKMQDAMNKFVMAFEKPEMIAAMDKLAEAAPKLAEGLAKIVEFVAKNPLASGVLAVGGLAGGSFAKGALGSAGERIFDKAMSSKAADKLGDAIAKKFTLAATGDSKWATAGKALGIAAAALIAFQIGKLAIDDAMNEDSAKQHSLQDAASTAEAMAKHGTGSPEERAKAAKALREKIAQAEKDGGPGLVTSAFGNAATLFGGEDPEEMFQRDLDNARKQLAALEAGKPALAERMAATAPSVPAAPPSEEAKKIAQEVTNGEPRKVAISNEQAMAGAIARMLGSTTLNVRLQGGGGTGSNGLPGAPGNTPGSTPKS